MAKSTIFVQGLKISDLLNELCSLSDHEIKTQTNKKLYRPIDEKIRIGDPSKLNALRASASTKHLKKYWIIGEKYLVFIKQIKFNSLDKSSNLKF